MVEEVVIATAGVIFGISCVYYLLLRCAQNDWIGEIPHGPKQYPVLGCLLFYLKIPDLMHEVEKNFLVYGNIFRMKCWRQKVVFVNDLENLIVGVKERQVENTTISHFSKLLSTVQTYIKKKEVVYLQNIWDSSFIHMIKVVDDDSALLKLIAEKISEEDEKVALENGLINQLSPCSSKTKLKCNSDANIILEDGLEQEVLDDLSEVIKKRPLLWKHFFFKYFGGWSQNKIARNEVRRCLVTVQEHLSNSMQILNIQTERRFLLILYLMVKLTNLKHHSIQKSDLALGPDICGWRTYICQEYADVAQYKIPKHSIIISKS